ncbi:MAG: hypothetical protein IPH08_04625 [Rhodocyclaceae bacterium]|nr:hypothetical protein [Rhodocyclaceae bacterium]
MKTAQTKLLTINEVFRIDAKAVNVLTVESGAAWVTVTGCVQDFSCTQVIH